MEKANKLNFVSASQPVIEQPLPVGFSPAPSAEVHSRVTEEVDDDDNTTVDKSTSKEEETEQVC